MMLKTVNLSRDLVSLVTMGLACLSSQLLVAGSVSLN